MKYLQKFESYGGGSIYVIVASNRVTGMKTVFTSGFDDEEDISARCDDDIPLGSEGFANMSGYNDISQIEGNETMYPAIPFASIKEATPVIKRLKGVYSGREMDFKIIPIKSLMDTTGRPTLR